MSETKEEENSIVSVYDQAGELYLFHRMDFQKFILPYKQKTTQKQEQINKKHLKHLQAIYEQKQKKLSSSQKKVDLDQKCILRQISQQKDDEQKQKILTEQVKMQEQFSKLQELRRFKQPSLLNQQSDFKKKISQQGIYLSKVSDFQSDGLVIGWSIKNCNSVQTNNIQKISNIQKQTSNSSYCLNNQEQSQIQNSINKSFTLKNCQSEGQLELNISQLQVQQIQANFQQDCEPISIQQEHSMGKLTLNSFKKCKNN